MSADSVFGPIVQVIFVCLMGAAAKDTLNTTARKEKIAKRRDENYGHEARQGGLFM
jgi:hypothetical protein